MEDIEQMIEEFRHKSPKRRIIYLDSFESFGERTSFNSDILKGALCDCALDIEFFPEHILVSLESVSAVALQRRLLFECAIVGVLCEGGVALFFGGDTCDIMSVACRLLEEFKK